MIWRLWESKNKLQIGTEQIRTESVLVAGANRLEGGEILLKAKIRGAGKNISGIYSCRKYR
jgi:hypothetical protein